MKSLLEPKSSLQKLRSKWYLKRKCTHQRSAQRMKYLMWYGHSNLRQNKMKHFTQDN